MNWNTEPLAADPRQFDAAVRAQLSDIAAASQLLLRSAQEKDRRYLALINRAAFRCAQIVYEGELARRLDSDTELNVRFAAMDLADWFRTAGARAAALLEKSGVVLTVTCEEKTLPTMGDQELLDALLYALLSNAVKAAGEDGKVSVSLASRGGYAVLTVGNEGAGFSEEALERLLGDGALEPELTPGAGAGLGVRLSRAIAEFHGGLLMLETGPGAGTRAAASLLLREGSRPRFESPSDGFDRALTALADVLPPECYAPGV